VYKGAKAQSGERFTLAVNRLFTAPPRAKFPTLPGYLDGKKTVFTDTGTIKLEVPVYQFDQSSRRRSLRPPPPFSPRSFGRTAV
jgi:hypothetical protein